MATTTPILYSLPSSDRPGTEHPGAPLFPSAAAMFNVEEVIDMSGDPVATPSPVSYYHTDDLCPLTSPKIEPTKEQSKLIAWFIRQGSGIAHQKLFAHEGLLPGELPKSEPLEPGEKRRKQVPQTPKWIYNKFHEWAWKNRCHDMGDESMRVSRIPPDPQLHVLTHADILSHISGKCTIHVYPNWRSGLMIGRVDMDAHHGEPDLAEAAQWVGEVLAANLPGGRDHIYSCPSSRQGQSLYLIVQIFDAAAKRNDPDYRPATSIARMNAQMDLLGKSLRTLAQNEGFQADVEDVMGRFPVIDHEDKLDEMGVPLRPPKLIELPQHGRVKLPSTWNGLQAIRNLKPIGLFHFQKMVETLSAAAAQCPKPEKPEKPTSPTPEPFPLTAAASATSSSTTSYPRRALQPLTPTGSKFADRQRCISRAMRILGLGASDHEIIELANSLYVEAGMASGPRDADRDRAFADILRHFKRTWDGETRGGQALGGQAEGGSEVWYGADSLAVADRLCRSRISNARLDEAIEACRKSHSPLISRDHLAHVVCVISKNMNRAPDDPKYAEADRCCPLTAIVGMWKSNGLAGDDRSAGIAVKLILDSKLVSTDGKWFQGHARRFELSAAVWNLPFLAELKPAGIEAELAKSQARDVKEAADGNVAAATSQDSVFYESKASYIDGALSPTAAPTPAAGQQYPSNEPEILGIPGIWQF